MELAFVYKKELREQVCKILKSAISKVNKTLKLNVTVGISIDIGTNYAECH